MALVIVLAFVALLTILIVSFISYNRLNRISTANYSKSIEAQEIAEGGLEDILYDLHQEIVAGSTTYNSSSGTPYTNSYANVYVPTTNWTAQPARLGFGPGYASLYGSNVSSTLLPPTLIRISKASGDGMLTDFYPPLSSSYYTSSLMPSNRASSASTTNSSVNGRTISTNRWNKICLLSTNSIVPTPFATNTPDWVYVTRSGSRAFASTSVTNLMSAPLGPGQISSAGSASTVVGRYAYVVYDEGALLDVNVAGYGFNKSGYATAASAYPTNFQGIIGAKGNLAFADLTQLPGFNVTGGQTNIDNLVKWRNASAVLTGSTATAQTNYLAAVAQYATNGFLTFNTNDSPLLNRQDLINYFANLDPGFNTTTNSLSEALPYLGTFSRASTAPSWRPLLNATSLGAANNGANNTYAYANNAESTNITSSPNTGNTNAPSPASAAVSNPNSDIPNVRFAHSGLVTHYNDNGTSYTYTVNVGDPVVQRRFSLAKIAWVTYEGPSATLPTSDPLYNAAGTAAAIYACFGLTWDTTSGTYRWDYNHTTSNPTDPNNILTLSQVAALSTPREPDFFELLKAGILNGSVGGWPGYVASVDPSLAPPPTYANTGFGVTGPAGEFFEYYSAEQDRHIRQIGVNIIDQASPNNCPTAIYQNLDIYTSPTFGEEDLFNTVFGIKNLPYIQRAWTISYVPMGDTNSSSDMEDTWIQPELWNPNISSTASTNSFPNTPTELRMVTFGSCLLNETEPSSNGQPTIPATHSLTVNFGSNPLSPLSQGIVPFINPQVASKYTALNYPFFDTPQTLVGYGVTNQNNYEDPPLASNPTPPVAMPSGSGPQNAFYYDNTNVLSGRPEVIGPWVGQTARDPKDNPNSHTVWVDPTRGLASDPEITVALQYLDKGSTPGWHTYAMMARLSELGFMGYDSHSIPGLTGPQRIYTVAHPDPRTDRFSSHFGYFGSGGQNYNFAWSQNETVRSANCVTSVNSPTPISGSTEGRGGLTAEIPSAAAFSYHDFTATAQGAAWPSYLVDDWANNTNSTVANYYTDPDGVTRPGDSWRADYEPDASGTVPGIYTKGGDGVLTYQYLSYKLGGPFNSSTSVLQARARGIVMNRPYRSVGEIGYAFRDQPFKTIDLWSPLSADSGLLDIFSAVDEPSVVAGEINPNNAPASVLQSILSGAMKQYYPNTFYGTNIPTAVVTAANTEAGSIAAAISTELAANGPLNNRADLVSRFSNPVYNSYTFTAGGDNPQCNKAYGETYVRALAPVANTRTWNLLIDVVAQAGHMSPTAQTLNDFVVEGERRYWLHVAIDRYTGKIVDQQLEAVHE